MMVSINGWNSVICKRSTSILQKAFAITGICIGSKIIGNPAIYITDMLLILSNKEKKQQYNSSNFSQLTCYLVLVWRSRKPLLLPDKEWVEMVA